MTICIIPARSGSKRIKNKNIKPFGGKPIISYEYFFKNRKNKEGMDRLQQAYECGLLYTCF